MPAADGRCADGDHDHIVAACDLCPSEPETYNGIDDHDGCPDRPDHSGMFDPRLRYAAPLAWLPFSQGQVTVALTHGAALDGAAAILNEEDTDIESVACVAQSSSGEEHPTELSLERARGVCAALQARGVAAERLHVLGTGTGPLREVDRDRPAASVAIIQVLRAAGYSIYVVGTENLTTGEEAPRHREAPLVERCDRVGAPTTFTCPPIPSRLPPARGATVFDDD